MPHVSIREIETFREASAWTEERARLDILRVAGLTRREVRQSDARIPIETLGLLWTTTAHRFPIPFALSVAEAHTETTKAYGIWGEMMDLAKDVRERLVAGFKSMAVHADDPKWELKVSPERFWLVRKWNYPNTTRRAECFATISELREWLIVMQRHVREPLQAVGLALPFSLFFALSPEEIKHLSGFFGCPVGIAPEPSLAFPRTALDFSSTRQDPQKFVHLQKTLMGAAATGTPLRPPLIKEIPHQGLVPLQRPSLVANVEMQTEPFLFKLENRHRAALTHAVNDAATYFAPLGEKRRELCGIDIGGGTLEVTELFFRTLKTKTNARMKLTVVDPFLKEAKRIERDLKIPIELVGKKWMAFEKDLPEDKKFDFAFTCQFFSLLTPLEIEQIYRSVYKRLSRGGRFFNALEPYDRATLPQYRHLVFYHKPVEWYREQAMRQGFQADPTSLYPAHAGDPSQVFVCLRFRKVRC